MVLSYLGAEFTEPELGRLLGTDGYGTLFDDIIRVSQLGFDVTLGNGARSDLLHIRRTGLPLITPVHSLLLPNYGPPGSPHSVVVAGATSTEVALFDPDRSPAPTVMPLSAFLSAWERRKFRFAQIRRL
jgi:ABC-type bacteriocin/lantibiotic exporter with double-glycine peptidase domain